MLLRKVLTMQDRLIDLIQTSVGGCARHWAEVIADYLIENGVVVLPCKVGDVVYVVKPYFSSIQEYQVRGYHLGEFPTLNGHKRKSYLICYHKASSALKHLPIDEIGKTVFFNREDAEAKLKGETK